jgi:hypothetical protein
MAATPTAIETVKMDDGKIVEFAGKRKLLKTSLIDDKGIYLRMDFRNGEVRTFTMPESLYERFAAHGAEQKFGDEIAGLDAIDDCVLAIDDLMARMEAGDWNVKREANGMAGTSVLLKALVEVTGKDVAAIKTFLADKTQAQKVALRNSPKLKPTVDRIEAEKASKGSKVDTDALLGELDGGAEALVATAETSDQG